MEMEGKARWLVACAAGIVTLLAGFAARRSPLAGGTVSLSSYGLVDSVPLEISASNLEYGLASAAGVGYPWLREASLVEPFRETTLRAVGCELTSEVWRYEWEVRAVSGAKSASAVATFAATGVSASHTFTRLGQYEATLRETRDSTAAEVDALARWVAQLDENDVESRSRSMMRSLGQATTLRTTRRSRTRTLYCRYVRRDIRRMSEGDRDNFFSAFLTLATVGATEGRRLYGDSYLPLDHFVALHLELAADRIDDHMHDGLGFLTMHVGLTAFFERGLQAVDPSIAHPFWDYTYDDALFKSTYGAHTPLDTRFWSLDDLWSDSWFGSAENDQHTVTSGRFAYQRVPTRSASADATGVDSRQSVANPYGYLRAPWNANAKPFVTRVHQLCGGDALADFGWPSCEAHHNLTFTTTSFYEWAWKVSYAAHGPVHAAIGGTFQCKEEFDALREIPMLEEDVRSLRTLSFVILKSGWRAGLVELPKSCSLDTPRAECSPRCEGLEAAASMENISKLEELWQVLFQGSRLCETCYDHAAKLAALTTVCNTPIAPGDQLEASSAVDVSFWPVHPTLERLWAYKKLLSLTGSDDTSATLAPTSSGAFQTEAWSNQDEGPTQYCHNNGCKGHHPADVVPFPVQAQYEDTGFEARTLSNIELYHLMDPHYSRLTYVYADFDWDHCEQMGVKFPALRK